MPGAKCRFGEVEFDPSELLLKVGGRIRALEPKSYRLLAFLIENRSRLVTKEEILRIVWDEAAVTDNSLTRAIAQIRKALDDDARQPRFIETVPTVGYRFIATLEELPAPAPMRNEIPSKRPRIPWTFAGAVAIAVAAAVWVAKSRPEPAPKVIAIRRITNSSAADTGPSFSPDGSQIAFSSNRTGHYELYLRSLAPDGADRQLTSDGQENLQPAWSPDGRYLAYASQEHGGIKMVPVSGGAPRYLSEIGDSPQWSPDGRTLVIRQFASPAQNPSFETTPEDKATILALVDAQGGPAHPLTRKDHPPFDPTFPRWLADGRHILFTSRNPDSRAMGLWEIDVASRESRQIHPGTFPLMGAFSPDGRYLYYTDMEISVPGILRAKIGGGGKPGSAEAIIPMQDAIPRDLTISADGLHLAYTRESGESAIWSVPVDAHGVATGEPKPLIRDRAFRNVDAVISANGARIAWTSIAPDNKFVIYVANSDGSGRTAITPADQRSNRPQWVGPDLKLGYFVHRNGRGSYWIAPLDGKPEQVFPALDLDHCDRLRLSPDGAKLVAHTTTPAGLQIVVGDLRGGRARAVTPATRNIGFPAWSPDGRWIAAQERTDRGVDLVVFPSGGGEVRTIETGCRQNFAYDWSPDSRRILFAGFRNRVWDIYWVSFPAGKVEQLTHFTTQSGFVRYPSWSPAGDRVVFEHNDLSANIYVADLKP